MPTLDVSQNCIDQADIGVEHHRRGRNWIATVRFDPRSPGALARVFWGRGSGTYRQIPNGTTAGSVIEVGHDYITTGNHRHPHREYFQVADITPGRLELLECPAPCKTRPGMPDPMPPTEPRFRPELYAPEPAACEAMGGV